MREGEGSVRERGAGGRQREVERGLRNWWDLRTEECVRHEGSRGVREVGRGKQRKWKGVYGASGR